jgi:uncharacterized protein (DUF302 family)
LPPEKYTKGFRSMIRKEIAIQRISVVSSKPFEDVIAALDAAIGHPNMGAFRDAMTSAKTYAELERVVDGAIGPSGLMEFMRLDLGDVVRKKHGGTGPKSVRMLVGNPVIMAQMVEHTPDAGSYAPVTILVDERADGVHLTYDTMGSLLASYKNAEAMKVALDLDAKVLALISTAA